VTYHPDSRYWSIQLIETGIFLAAGLALIGFAAWWVMRRVE
jgi:LPXTG-motif cell wall-anchored protein